MSQIKLVLSDMDDTLAPHMQNKISDAVKQATSDVQKKGITIAVVTGRAYPHAKEVLNILGITGPCVFDGGASIVDVSSGEILWKQWLDVETTCRVISVLKAHCSEAFFSETYAMQELSLVDIEQIHHEAPCIFSIADTMDQVELAAKQLETIDGIKVFFGMGTHPTTNEPWPAMQITHKFADKFHGVEALRSIINMEREHTLAIGDGKNDVPLFENANVKVAMGNAGDDLKARADYVTKPFTEDGFAVAMQQYVLSK